MQGGISHLYLMGGLRPEAQALVLFAGLAASPVERFTGGGWGLAPQARTVQHQAPETW